MGYIDARRLTEATEIFVKSLGKDSNINSARSFFESDMSNLYRSFTNGVVKREDLGKNIGNVLNKYKIYPGSTSLDGLQKKINNM